jgi:hypothetical protein
MCPVRHEGFGLDAAAMAAASSISCTFAPSRLLSK